MKPMRDTQFYSDHIGKEFGRNEYRSLTLQAIHSVLSSNTALFPRLSALVGSEGSRFVHPGTALFLPSIHPTT
jgi:hypothetical protein